MCIVRANPETAVRRLPDDSGIVPYLDPYAVRFKPCYGWTRAITLLDDPRLFSRFPQFRAWSKVDHLRESAYARTVASELESTYGRLVSAALDTYGDHGTLISGCVQDHFPEVVKDTLRTLAYRASKEFSRSLTHWYAAGRRSSTWRKVA